MAGAGHRIRPSQINDDYCDCDESGIDETATNACDKGRFYCASRFAIEKWVHSSKVNDGFCDCCDCSDEFAPTVPGKPARRENTCFSKFKQHIDGNIGEIKDVRSS